MAETFSWLLGAHISIPIIQYHWLHSTDSLVPAIKTSLRSLPLIRPRAIWHLLTYYQIRIGRNYHITRADRINYKYSVMPSSQSTSRSILCLHSRSMFLKFEVEVCRWSSPLCDKTALRRLEYRWYSTSPWWNILFIIIWSSTEMTGQDNGRA